MPSTFLIGLSAFLFIVMAGGAGYPQTPPPGSQQNAPADETGPPPEVQKQISIVNIEDNRLSVELVNANFGETIRAIAQKGGFSIEGHSDVFSTKVTTKFSNLDIDSGFARLFSLVKEKNYLISYDAKGSISRVEIYGNASSGSSRTMPAPRQMTPVRRNIGPPFPASPQPVAPRMTRPVVRSLPQPPPQPQQGEQETQDIEHEEVPPEQGVREIPYIPPQQKPVYIPPVRR